MNKKLAALPALLLAALCAPAAQAASGDKLNECVELSADHRTVRFGSEKLILKNQGAHYRLDFYGSCDAIAMTTKILISSDGVGNRLCPAGTRVGSKPNTCKVRSVEEIAPEEFDRYARRNGR